MKSNYNVAEAFWNKKPSKNRSMESTGNKLFSYNTCILQRTRYGYTIGNFTNYSVSTLKHQYKARVRKATYYVLNIPKGTQNLTNPKFKKMIWKPGRKHV